MGAGEVSWGASGIYVGTWGLQGYRGREGSIKGGRGRGRERQFLDWGPPNSRFSAAGRLHRPEL